LKPLLPLNREDRFLYIEEEIGKKYERFYEIISEFETSKLQ
jgi:hypothetical protein